MAIRTSRSEKVWKPLSQMKVKGHFAAGRPDGRTSSVQPDGYKCSVKLWDTDEPPTDKSGRLNQDDDGTLHRSRKKLSAQPFQNTRLSYEQICNPPGAYTATAAPSRMHFPSPTRER